MTWFSQLLPNRRNPQRRASHDDRGPIRRGKGRRRILVLESLERRTVLSNVTTLPSPTGLLTITGDIFNDSFSITENAAGKISVAPTSVRTTMNFSRFGYTDPFKVTSIVLDLPGTTNFDTVSLIGLGKTKPSTVTSVVITATGANVTFAANGFDSSGPLTLANTATLPAGNNGALHANIDNSTFSTISITQTGNTLASVELGNTSTSVGGVTGAVNVSEGVGSGDAITLDSNSGGGDTFGSTTLTQGAGPIYAGALGTGDSTSVSGAGVQNLTIRHLLNGNGDSVSLNTVSVAETSFGVVTSQGAGNGDTAAINLVTSPIPTNPASIAPNGPPSIVTTQGGGSGDSASVTNSKLAGSISITQQDVAANPIADTATMTADTVGFTETTSGKVTAAFAGNLTISQGNAGGKLNGNGVGGTPGDQATVSKSTAVGGNVVITQGDGGGTVDKNAKPTPGDLATVSSVVAGTLLSTGAVVGGNITTTQGSGSADSATVSGSTAHGNVLITQTDVVANPGGDPVTVSGDTVSGSITISQGSANGDTVLIDPTSAGGNVSIGQGNGAGDLITVTKLTIPAPPGTVTLPPAYVPPGLLVTQGSGSGDSASVTNSTLAGSISITQMDVAGNALPDTATLTGDKVGFTQSSSGKIVAAVAGNLTIIQGNAGGHLNANGLGGTPGDQATVSNSTAVGGNVVITQGNGGGTVDKDNKPTPGDLVTVTNVNAGTLLGTGAVVGGNFTITQGAGIGDVTTITGVTAPLPTSSTAVGPPTPASILITQGNGNADSASVTTATLPGNITIKQGNGNGDSAVVSAVHVGFKITSGGKTEVFFGNVTINQGTGKGNIATVDTANSVILGKVTIT